MDNTGTYPSTRLRRLRQNPALRRLLQDITVHPEKLVLPLFIRHGHQIKNPIASMPGHFQLSVDYLEEEIGTLLALGIRQVILFGIPAHKDALGTDSYAENGIIQQAIVKIKKIAPELLVIVDNCFCEYTDHGHCGVLTTTQEVDNDQTLVLLAKQAVSHADAGADVIAPSGMMDGAVAAIRRALDAAGYTHIPILSYAIKYSSAFYGPFRQAAEGAPQFGDRRSYQADFANTHESLRECALDIQEGADMLMVKPAHTYLDVICRIKTEFPAMPLCAYHTSGEFAMLKAAAAKGWIDEKSSVIEVLTAIHRAGANFIITYYAKEVAAWLRE